MGSRRIVNILSQRCPSAGNSRMRGSLPTKLPRDKQMTLRQHAALLEAIHQHCQRPALVVLAQPSREKHHLGLFIHDSDQPRQPGRELASKVQSAEKSPVSGRWH